MSEWKEVTIGNHIDLISGYAFKSVDFLSNQVASTLPVIKIKNVANGDVNLNDVVFHQYNENLEKFLLSKGDVLIAMTGNHPQAETQVVGDVSRYKLNEKALLNQRVGKLIVKDDTNLDFIYYLFKNDDVRYYLANQSSGSANQANISKGDILGLNLTIPLPTEQTAIAAVLSSLDNKIDLLHRQNTTLEKMAETLFRQWFVEEAKEEWNTDTLENLFDIGIGRTPPRKEQHWFSESLADIKWVSIKDMGTSGVYISNVSEYLTQEAVDRFSIPIIPENTVMLSFKMTIGRLAISTEKMLSNEAIAHFKVKKGSKFFSEFLYLYLKTYQWEQLGSTSSIVDAINSQMIKEMELVIPEEKKLKDFRELIFPFFEKIKKNQSQINTLAKLRDSLLPKLMSGEVTIELVNN